MDFENYLVYSVEHHTLFSLHFLAPKEGAYQVRGPNMLRYGAISLRKFKFLLPTMEEISDI